MHDRWLLSNKSRANYFSLFEAALFYFSMSFSSYDTTVVRGSKIESSRLSAFLRTTSTNGVASALIGVVKHSIEREKHARRSELTCAPPW